MIGVEERALVEFKWSIFLSHILIGVFVQIIECLLKVSQLNACELILAHGLIKNPLDEKVLSTEASMGDVLLM